MQKTVPQLCKHYLCIFVGSVLSSQGREAARQGVPGLCPQHSPAPLPSGCTAQAGFAAARRPCASCWAPLGEPVDSQPVCSAQWPNSSSSNHWVKSELRLGGPSTLQKAFGHKAWQCGVTVRRQPHRRIGVCRSEHLCRDAAFCNQQHIFVSSHTRPGKIRNYSESEQCRVVHCQ